MSIKALTSRDNPVVKQLIALARSAKERTSAGYSIIDGAHLISAWAAAGGDAHILAISVTGMAQPELAALFERVTAHRRLVLADTLFTAIAPVATPSGLLAAIAIPRSPPLPTRIGDAILLDRVQEPGNAGSLLRTAGAAGIRHVLTTPGTVDLWAPKVLRGAMGAHFGMVIHEGIALGLVAERAGGALIATAGQGTHNLYDADLRAPAIWLFGNEGAGLDATTLSRATLTLRIPIASNVESLNVAAAAAVCLFEQRRQRRNE